MSFSCFSYGISHLSCAFGEFNLYFPWCDVCQGVHKTNVNRINDGGKTASRGWYYY